MRAASFAFFVALGVLYSTGRATQAAQPPIANRFGTIPDDSSSTGSFGSGGFGTDGGFGGGPVATSQPTLTPLPSAAPPAAPTPFPSPDDMFSEAPIPTGPPHVESAEPDTTRQNLIATLEGDYELAYSSEDRCTNTFSVMEPPEQMEGKYIISSEKAFGANGEQCSSTAFNAFWQYIVQWNATENWALGMAQVVFFDNTGGNQHLLHLANNTEGMLLYVLPETITCQDKSIQRGSAILFLHPEEPINFPLGSDSTLPAGQDALILLMENEVDSSSSFSRSEPEFGGRYSPCLYRPSGKALPTPTSPPPTQPTPKASELPSSSATPTTEAPDLRQACFPGDATVLVGHEKVETRMEDLELGDLVLVSVSPEKFSQVYFFGHKNSQASTEFVEISLESNDTLVISPDHYMYRSSELVTASSVRTGDLLTVSSGGTSRVQSVRNQISQRGLYAPHTATGYLFVNGVRVSSYTAALHPSVAHTLLWPARLWFSATRLSPLSALFEADSRSHLIANCRACRGPKTISLEKAP